MATALTSLVSRLNTEIKIDRNNKIWSQSEKEQFCNDGYFQVQKDMGTRYRPGQTSASFATVPGTQEYALPTDFLMARLVTYNGQPLDKIEYEDLKEQNVGNTQAIPYEYYIYGDNIGLNAIPIEVKTVVLYYRKRLATLTSVQATTLSSDFDLPIVKYAAYLLWSTTRGNIDTARAKLADYKQAMDTMFFMYALQDSADLTYRPQRRSKNWASTPRNLL